MATPDHSRKDDREVLQNAIDSINRDPQQDELRRAATDFRDPRVVDRLRELMRSDFGKLKAGKEGKAMKKVLTPDERKELSSGKKSLFSVLQSRLHPSEGNKWARFIDVKNALEAADESDLYGLLKMEENGHEVGVKLEVRAGRKGFRFDSRSASSPVGVRNVNYPRAEEIAEKKWGVPLMSKEVFEELQFDGIITEEGTWSHLKTDAEMVENGLSWCGDDDGVIDSNAEDHDRDGGFRCSLWVCGLCESGSGAGI